MSDGRAENARRIANELPRDDQGRFMPMSEKEGGSSGGSSSKETSGGSSSGGQVSGLEEGRSLGGKRSAEVQERDDQGRFAGKSS